MERFKYRAINNRGRPVRGIINAANETDLYNQLQTAGLELVQCSSMAKKKSIFSNVMPGKKVQIRDLIQFFLHLEQMQGAGVPLLDALKDIRDSTDHDQFRDILSEICRNVYEGTSLSEAMDLHPKVFTKLYVSLIAAGEETGDLLSTYQQLMKYLKWVDDMQSKVRKAVRYPMVVTGVVLIAVTIMMTVVVPQIVGFIRNLDQEIPFYTKALVATSDFFVSYWWVILITPPILFMLYKILRNVSDDIAYRFDTWILAMPIFGPLIRKINIARFAQTFGALFASGIDILQGLEAARGTVFNLALVDALDSVGEQVRAGSPLSEAFATTGEFPIVVTRMIRVGEESGDLNRVLEQVAEFYTKDVDEAVQGMISMIEPFLTAFLGGMIMWIAIAVFGPIYSAFEDLDI